MSRYGRSRAASSPRFQPFGASYLRGLSTGTTYRRGGSYASSYASSSYASSNLL